MYDTEGEVYYNDARKIKPEELPDFDLICGGFPCQSFSIAGKRKGSKDDTRGTLFFEIARIAAVKKPKYLLLENVPGLLSHDSGRTFAAILSALDELGYDVTWQVINSADHNVAQSRKRVFIIGFLRSKCSGKILSFTEANPKTLAQRIPGREGCRVYSTDGLSITLTGSAGGFGGKTGLYEILGLPIKVKTKSGYQVALPGDSIDLAYPNINSRRGRVGHDIAHTVTPGNTQGSYQMYCIDMNPAPDITELARCITARQDNGITYHKGEHSAALMVADAPIPVLTPAKDKIRQQGRRFKNPDEPAFTITVTDRNGVVYGGLIRKLLPLECWRLQGFTDEQFSKVQNTGMSDAQLYKQAGNAVTVNVIAALAEFIKEIDEEMKNA
jgi:DNA (cytosine-5)-methyltransferase 1